MQYDYYPLTKRYVTTGGLRGWGEGTGSFTFKKKCTYMCISKNDNGKMNIIKNVINALLVSFIPFYPFLRTYRHVFKAISELRKT